MQHQATPVPRLVFCGDPRVTTAARVRDQNVGTRNNIRFSFQATIAYYIYRCLGPQPGVPANQMQFERQYRQFDILFGYILLEVTVCGLMFERTFGINGRAEAPGPGVVPGQPGAGHCQPGYPLLAPAVLAVIYQCRLVQVHVNVRQHDSDSALPLHELQARLLH